MLLTATADDGLQLFHVQTQQQQPARVRSQTHNDLDETDKLAAWVSEQNRDFPANRPQQSTQKSSPALPWTRTSAEPTSTNMSTGGFDSTF